jgi:thiamine biosynthesis lipoprotein
MATEGAVDPLVGHDLELLGYDSKYSLTPSTDLARAETRTHEKNTWSKDVIRNGTTLITRNPLVIDVGAAGKGYLVDIVTDILLGSGFNDFVVDGSGDLRHSGQYHIKVGLEHPFDPNLIIGTIDLKNSALCASAINRRAWGDGLHHVLDARTGVPVRDVVATWVISEEAAVADGLATAMFFKHGNELTEFPRFSYVRMFADGHAEASMNFDGEIFS